MTFCGHSVIEWHGNEESHPLIKYKMLLSRACAGGLPVHPSAAVDEPRRGAYTLEPLKIITIDAGTWMWQNRYTRNRYAGQRYV